MTIAADHPATQFTLPPGSEASGPPERRGVRRDGVRLLVARPGRIEHRRFVDLPCLLEPGDLVVVNTSATVPAAVSDPLADYQTVYAPQPGSAEMASAGRPFTAPLVVRLMAVGATFAPIVLHAGVSSLEVHEPPAPERFEVSEPTARLVQNARESGHRVIAVGTTVVRALETAAHHGGLIKPARGWTDLVLGPGHPVRVVTGLITRLHAPQASICYY